MRRSLFHLRMCLSHPAPARSRCSPEVKSVKVGVVFHARIVLHKFKVIEHAPRRQAGRR